jgi:hypothetical protein
MLICVESGMSIEAAIAKVGAEVGGASIELAEELSLLTAELSYLPERRLAYEGLAKRTNHPGIRSVVTAMIQAERYGTPLGSALRVMAKENRDLRLSAAEKKAAALPAKLTVPMILFFLPVLFIVIMGPAIMKIQDAFTALQERVVLSLAGGGAQPGQVVVDRLRRQILAGQLLGLVDAALQPDHQGQVLANLDRGVVGRAAAWRSIGLGPGQVAGRGQVHGQVRQGNGFGRGQGHGLAMGRQGLVVALGLLVGHAQQRQGPPVARLQGGGLAARLDGVEALAARHVGPRGFHQGVIVVGRDDQDAGRRVGGFVIAAQGAQGLGQAHARLDVATVALGFGRPEGHAGQGIGAPHLGPLGRRGLARRLWRGGGGLRSRGRRRLSAA